MIQVTTGRDCGGQSSINGSKRGRSLHEKESTKGCGKSDQASTEAATFDWKVQDKYNKLNNFEIEVKTYP